MLLDMHMIGIDYVKKNIINNTKKLGNNKQQRVLPYIRANNPKNNMGTKPWRYNIQLRIKERKIS